MLKKLILSILICIYSNANTLKINDKISNFSLANQFDKIHTVNSEISMIIVTFQRNTSNLVNDFLSSKDSDFLHKKNTIFINNISSIPSIVTKMFIIPKMRRTIPAIAPITIILSITISMIIATIKATNPNTISSTVALLFLLAISVCIVSFGDSALSLTIVFPCVYFSYKCKHYSDISK